MHVRVHLAGTAHITWWPMFTPFKISSSQCHHLLLHIDSGKKRYIILKPLLFFLKWSKNHQKWLSHNKGTVHGSKGRSGRPLQLKMLRGASSSVCLSFVFCPLVSLSRGFWVLLKHRGESAWGREAVTPLLQWPVLVGMWMAAAGPSSLGSVRFPWRGTYCGVLGCQDHCCCCWKEDWMLTWGWGD